MHDDETARAAREVEALLVADLRVLIRPTPQQIREQIAETLAGLVRMPEVASVQADIARRELTIEIVPARGLDVVVLS